MVAIFLLDVLIFVALFVAGAAIPAMLNAPDWSAPVFVTIPFVYAWWRGALGLVTPKRAALLVAALAPIIAIDEPRFLEGLLAVPLLIHFFDIRERNRNRTDDAAPNI
jgi:hypothetical protein